MTELGTFLRARRTDGRLQPPMSGNRRRRISGLRREEVAAMSGISVDYYTRLEQGRETNPSDSVLGALARTLQLEPDATDHLYRLRDHHSASVIVGASDDVVARMQSLAQAVRPNPAYVLDRLSNMVAANAEGLALFDGIVDSAAHTRNTCRYLLTHPRAKETFLDWTDVARGAVAHLRAANASNLSDPQLQSLVAELRRSNELFDAWWDGHLVERRRASAARIRAADGVVRSHRFEVLHLPEDGMRMTLWLTGSPT